jgi:hypothetical protein
MTMDILDEITDRYITFLYERGLIKDAKRDAVYPILQLAVYERLYNPSIANFIEIALKSKYKIGQ